MDHCYGIGVVPHSVITTLAVLGELHDLTRTVGQTQPPLHDSAVATKRHILRIRSSSAMIERGMRCAACACRNFDQF